MVVLSIRSEGDPNTRPRTKVTDSPSPAGRSWPPVEDYGKLGVLSIVSERSGWLLTFFLGLLLASLVVQRFDMLLERHVALSFFVPLIIGHGGNTGSQTVSTLIRALTLNQVSYRDVVATVVKESLAGAVMGSMLGSAILLLSVFWKGWSVEVGMVVATSLPLVSLWANGLGAFVTLLADKLKVDPASTSVPLMTTIIDATGLALYFYIAELILDVDLHAN